MVDWIVGGKHRLTGLLLAYVVLHVAARTFVSPTLGFDESEQAYLSQTIQLGYNSQPPLYTWMQAGIFRLLGCSAFSLALLKNAFLLATYLLAFAATRKATGDLRLATLAALGMLLIPQIAWESHRDLSHTVAATFATILLLFGIVQLTCQREDAPPDRSISIGYALIGFAIGIGVMFKYNFGIVVLGFVVACLSIDHYRKFLVNRRLIITAVIAAAIILPHAVWVLGHPELASSKTIATLTTNESDSWMQNVASGLLALAGSTFSCCALVAVVIMIFFRRLQRRPESISANGKSAVQTGLLLERFLVMVAVTLLLLVFSGHALEFKNRWLQPFVCVVPLYLAIRFGHLITGDVRAINRTGDFAMGIMFVVLVATVARPMIQGAQGTHGHLNVPFAMVAEQLVSDIGFVPQAIIVEDTRTAGNLRVAFPDARIIAQELPLPVESFGKSGPGTASQVLLFSEHDQPDIRTEHSRFAGRVLGMGSEFSGWQSVTAPIIHGDGTERKEFHYVVVDNPARIAAKPLQKR